MNKERRNEIKKIIKNVEEIRSNIELILDDEQDYYDNMPENLQGGDRGITSEEAIDNLQEAINNIEETISFLENASL